MRSSSILTSCAVMVVVLAGCLAPPAEAQIRRLAELSMTDIQALDRARTVVIIPAGLFEEHGPYLPAFTDGYQNEWLSVEVAEALVARSKRPVVLFPTIPLGVGSPEDFGGRRPFSGSYTVRPATLRAVFMDLASELGADGFRWIFVIHGHGSPSHNRALIEAADYFHDVYGGTMVALTAYQYVVARDRPAVWEGDDGRENAGDVHAGASETSRILFLRPELVHREHSSATPQTAATDADFARVAASQNWPGYFGSPRLATADAGAVLMRRSADDLSDLALRVLDGLDSRTLPSRGDTANEAFKVLDQNLIRRSGALESQQREWLQKRGLQ